MNRTSQLIAVLALGAAGAAFAQGNPPNTASPNPATAAGQQSPAGGPMGTTGTTPQNNMAGSTGGATMSQNSGSMNSGSMNSSSNTNMAAAEPMRPTRADRN